MRVETVDTMNGLNFHMCGHWMREGERVKSTGTRMNGTVYVL